MTSFAAAPLAARALLLALAAAVLLLVLAPAPGAHAYQQPPGGSWRFMHLFDDTRSGALSLSANASSVAKLTLVPGERSSDKCGTRPISLVSRPKVRSWSKVNGRYAVAVNPSGLFRPLPVSFKRGGRTVRGKLMLLWDEDGRMADGKVELPGDCHISFYAHARR